MKITPPVVILPLTAANGGTGQSSYVIGDLITANTTTTLARLADVAAGSYLRSGGVTTAPMWSTATLPNTATQGDLLYASAANVYGNLADVATGQVLTSGGVGVAPAWSATPTLTSLTLNGTLAMGANPITFTDATLIRDAANVLALRNGVNKQTQYIYETFTDAANYSRLEMGFGLGVGNRYYINTAAAGTGSQRNLGLAVGGTEYWVLNGSGTLAPLVANGYDLGSNAAPVRNVFIGTTLTGIPSVNTTAQTITGYSLTGASAASMVSYTGTLNTSGVVDVWKLAVTETASGAGSNLFAVYGGASGTTPFLTVANLVGMGTASPNAKLHVQGQGGSANTTFLATNAGDVTTRWNSTDASSSIFEFRAFGGVGGGARVGMIDNSILRFMTNSSDRLTIGGAGNVGIGANPNANVAVIIEALVNNSVIAGSSYSLTGGSTRSMINLSGTLNTFGVVDVWTLAVTETASGAGSNLLAIYGGAAGATARFAVTAGSATAVVIGSTTSLSLSGANNRVQVGPGTVPAKTGIAASSVAAAAAEDGGVMVATVDNTLVYYASGNRYKVVGVAF